jgi:hypothetical protein
MSLSNFRMSPAIYVDAIDPNAIQGKSVIHCRRRLLSPMASPNRENRRLESPPALRVLKNGLSLNAIELTPLGTVVMLN